MVISSVFSPIVEEPQDDEVPGVRTTMTGQNERHELRSSLPKDESQISQKLRDNPDIFSIFGLTIRFDIPSCDLNESKGITGVDSEETHRRVAYGLGSGLTCDVIRHETGMEAVEVCPVGRLNNFVLSILMFYPYYTPC